MIGVIRPRTSQLQVTTRWSTEIWYCVSFGRDYNTREWASLQDKQCVNHKFTNSVTPVRLNFFNNFNLQLSNPVVKSLCVNVTWVVWNCNLGETGNTFKALREYRSVTEHFESWKWGLFFVKLLDKSTATTPFTQRVAGTISNLYTNVFSIYHWGSDFHTL